MSQMPQPDLWFQNPPEYFANYTDPWPWANLAKDHLFVLSQGVQLFISTMTFYHSILTKIFCAMAVLGSIFTLLTAYHVHKAERLNTFHAIIIATACLDFIFAILFVTRRLVVQNFGVIGVVLIFSNFAAGTIFSLSLMSDMLALALTLDRFVALAFPLFYKINKRCRRWSWIIAISICILVASTRAHYAFENYFYVDADLIKTTWFPILTYVSDMILPFIIAIVMVILTLGICICMVKRYMSKVGTTSNNADEIRISTKKSITLLAALVLSIFLNQLAYMLVAVAIFKRDSFNLQYTSTLKEIQEYVFILKFFECTSPLSDITECAARGIIFYVYVLFNKDFRSHFFKLMRCKPTVVQTTVQQITVGGRA